MEKIKVKKRSTVSEENELKDLIVELIQEKKGKDIISLNLSKIPEAITDYFIICHGDSTTQTRAIIDFLESEIKKRKNIKPLHLEGKSNGEWCLIDFADVIVHVFLKEKREFYQLEDLWNDAIKEHYPS